MTKIKVNVQFKAEAYFDAVLELRPDNVEKLKEFIGEKKIILGNEEGADKWIKILFYNAEFDYVLKNTVDLEEIKITELDEWLLPINQNKQP